MTKKAIAFNIRNIIKENLRYNFRPIQAYGELMELAEQLEDEEVKELLIKLR